MNHLKLFERRISQLRSDITISYSLDVYTTKHSLTQSYGRDIEGYDSKPISNFEVSELIRHFRIPIAEKIYDGLIDEDIEFIVKSKIKMLSVVLIPKYEDEHWWRLIIKTVFRESENFSLRTGRNQIVITDDDI